MINSTYHIRNIITVFYKLVVIYFLIALLLPVSAQDKQVYQVKTLNPELKPYPNLQITLNEKKKVSINDKGLAFVELSSDELPIKSVSLNDKELEAASWNLSKGTLEIIIRKKSYRLIKIAVKNTDNTPLPNVLVTYNGRKKITATSDNQGMIEFPVPLDESLKSSAEFSVDGYNIKDLRNIAGQPVLFLEPISISSVQNNENSTVQPTVGPGKEYFNDFDLSKLDSIQSLTVFYAIFKNYQIEEMEEETQKKIDAKFNELVGELQDSLRRKSVSIFNNISDTTYVQDDIKSLLSQAQDENFMLQEQQSQFEEKIEIVNEKLAVGFENLDEAARKSLLEDLILLETILAENESRFYKNQNNYRQMVSSLKERFFDLEDLENKLSVSEAQRLKEQRIFRQRLFAVIFIATVFAVLIILLIYFSNKLKKQKQALIVANNEVKRINENLENLVYERTKLLEETNKELDTVLYRASHDLRSPVCSIQGLVNLASTLSNGENNELYERIIDTTKGMDKLLKKLSVISEINQPGDFVPIPLCQLIEEVSGRFNSIIRDNKINFKVECPDDLVIYSNPNLVEVILINLMENALFYCIIKNSNKYQVVLNANVINTNLELSMYDNGVGVEKSMSDRLFDMFFRGNEYSKGNGLGLYIVQKSVHALNGKITVESEPGKYSKFVVHLPEVISKEPKKKKGVVSPIKLSPVGSKEIEV